MKLFLDTANIASIQAWKISGLIDGVTTNPTHLSKEGDNPTQVVQKICALLPHGAISIEITEKEPEAVYQQAKKIAALADNVVVKIPCYKDYYPIIKRLIEENIQINITLVFTLMQGLFMCKLGAHYISPFVGRLDDTGANGIALVADLRHMIDNYGYFGTQILAASLRDIHHVHQVINAGADVATIPLHVMEALTQHPLTDKGMALFLSDWQKLSIKTFPS